jgi:outer membrane receptor for ferrienterochelin and colicins
MSKYVFVLLLALSSLSVFAQNSLRVTIKDAENKEPLTGVTVLLLGSQNGQSTDATGVAQLNNIPNGKQAIQFSFIGYNTRIDTLNFPLAKENLEIFLVSNSEELDEVIVESTRANRSIADLPTRIEALTEEIDEAAAMEPSRISHLITHSTGVQVQTTSATSNGSVVRIQGLNGRYTKLLKDGFPMYGGFSGSLDILQIPPLDLRQVEFVKGSSSTLHGGSAIGGILNLLTKTPKKDETLLHLNRSTIGSNDLNFFASRRFGKFGFTNLASYQLHQAYDADKDGYSDLPEVSKFNFNPKLFYYPSEKTTLYFGGMITREFRSGGDMKLIENQEPAATNFYKDTQNSNRYTTQFQFDTRFGDNQKLIFKNSFNFFDRLISIRYNPQGDRILFGGNQVSSFSELTYSYFKGKHELVVGLNYITDDFREKDLGTSPTLKRNQSQQTAGVFANHIWEIASFFSLESGLRADWNNNSSSLSNDKGNVYVLPRVNGLVRYSEKLTSRIGGGLGYRPLTIFNEEAEPLGFRFIQPVDYSQAKAEQSFGLNADVNYKNQFSDKVLLTFNQMFFYNQISNPIVLQSSSPTELRFVNSANTLQSRGFETQIKLTAGLFTWFFGYTYTDAFLQTPTENAMLILMPKHSIKGDLLFVIDGKWRIGWDYEYKSSQRLTNGQMTSDLFTTGVVIERTLGNFVLFFNAENITDVRQTRYGSLLTAPDGTPQFAEIYAPLDGRFFNLGLKVTL